MVGPARKREAVGHLQRELEMTVTRVLFWVRPFAVSVFATGVAAT